MSRQQAGITYYPLALRLKDRLALVIGGGKIAERKVGGLLKASARVKVVSPTLISGLSRLARNKKIVWLERTVQRKDIRPAAIVIAATDDQGVNEKVSQWARAKGAWVNVVDRSALSDFISPAVLRKQQALIAVYTDGKDPVLSRDLKNFLKEHWNDFLSYRHGL